MVLHKGELEAKLKDENQLIKSGVLRDENPLDGTEDFKKLLDACRRGDLKTCQELISGGVNINGKDNFDYTPLIIASLCGHFELVQLLLEAGALAERNTFQGERCIYNALNDRIRNLLLSYDFSKSTDPLQPWSSHITSLLSRESPKTHDIRLVTDSVSFQLHKFILSARAPYFRQKFADAPDLPTWKVSQAIPVDAFHVVLRYLYLGDLPRDIVLPGSDASEEEVFEGIDKLCKQLEIEKLWEAILSGNDRRLARQRYQDEVERAQLQVEGFFRDTVLKHRMDVDTRKAGDVKWPHDNAIFADCILRADDLEGDEEDAAPVGNLIGIPIGPAASSPSQNGQQNGQRRVKRSVLYPVHKAFLIRSPYFETMFASEFIEAQETEYLHIIKVDCVPAVLETILTFLYTEKADPSLDLALDLLYAADMLFLDKLKTKAAVTISTLGSGNNNVLIDRTHGAGLGNGEENGNGAAQEPVEVEPINVYDVIHAAWDLKVQRLEEFAARYLAYRLEDYIDEDEFAELIQESAGRLKDRQETDTIELLDDIRYYLSERFRLRFEDANLEDILDEEGELNAAVVDALGEQGDDQQQQQNGQAVENEAVNGDAEADGGGVRALDGTIAEDEFASDAINYQVLLEKIDTMLDKLKLDA